MANIYKSRYTGEQVDDLLGKAENATEVVAIPLDDDPNYLGAIRVNGTPYLIPVSDEVIANAGGAEGAYLFTLTIGDQKYLLPAYVSANPAESGAQNLTKLAIGSTIYNIPSGTVVLANDATPTTTELTTVNIGGVNYVIPKGATVLTNDGAVEGGFLYTLTVNGNKFKMPPYIKVNNDVEGDPTSTLTEMQIGNVVYQLPQGATVLTNDGAVEGGFLYTLTVNGNKFKMPPYIKVNNDVEGDPTSTLTEMQIGNVVYQLPQGGGSTVEANPSEDATSTLNKIGIDNVVYSLPTGGGGTSGGGYDLTIRGNYNKIELVAYKADGTQVPWTTYNTDVVLHNITAFETELTNISTYITKGLVFTRNLYSSGTAPSFNPHISGINVYKNNDYDDAVCVLIGNCEVYRTND